ERIEESRTTAEWAPTTCASSSRLRPGARGWATSDRLSRSSGTRLPSAGLPPDVYRQVRVSPDGSRLAFSAAGDIWAYDSSRAARSPVTTAPAAEINPLWTPDGRRIVFTSFRNGYPEMMWHAADGTGSDVQLFSRGKEKDLTNLYATGWSKDGKQL